MSGTLAARLRHDGPALAALAAAWVLGALLIDASGDMPLNDDWGYAPGVRALLDDGALRFSDWQSAPLLTHVLFGWLFALVGGAGHETLRVSMLVAGGLGVLALYGLLREAGVPRSRAALGAALLLANPMYFGLSATFMTDVSFTATLIAAAGAWLHAERTQSVAWRMLAVALTVAATLNRQLGIALPLAWTVVAALEHGVGRRWLVRAALPAACVLASLVVYERVIDATIGLPALYHVKSEQLGDALSALARGRGLRYPLTRTAMAVGYLGLFTLPLLRGRPWLPLAGAALGLGAGLTGAALPWTGNILIDFGMGPRTAVGAVASAPDGLWVALTALAGLGAGGFMQTLAQTARRAVWPRSAGSASGSAQAPNAAASSGAEESATGGDATAEGPAAEGTAAEGTAAEGTAAEGTAAEDAAAEDAAAEDAARADVAPEDRELAPESPRGRARRALGHLRAFAATRSGRASLLAVGTATVGIGPTLVVFAAFFDRYLLTPLPFAILLMALHRSHGDSN